MACFPSCVLCKELYVIYFILTIPWVDITHVSILRKPSHQGLNISYGHITGNEAGIHYSKAQAFKHHVTERAEATLRELNNYDLVSYYFSQMSTATAFKDDFDLEGCISNQKQSGYNIILDLYENLLPREFKFFCLIPHFAP